MQPCLDRVDGPVVTLREFFSREPFIVGEQHAVARLRVDRAEAVAKGSYVDHVRLPVLDPLAMLSEPIRAVVEAGVRTANWVFWRMTSIARLRAIEFIQTRAGAASGEIALPRSARPAEYTSCKTSFRRCPDPHDTKDRREKFRRGQLVEPPERRHGRPPPRRQSRLSSSVFSVASKSTSRGDGEPDLAAGNVARTSCRANRRSEGKRHPCGEGTSSSAGQRRHEVDDALAHLRILDAGESAVEVQTLRRRQEVHDVSAEPALGGGRMRHAVCTARRTRGRRRRNRPAGRSASSRSACKPAGADPVRALLVFPAPVGRSD